MSYCEEDKSHAQFIIGELEKKGFSSLESQPYETEPSARERCIKESAVHIFFDSANRIASSPSNMDLDLSFCDQKRCKKRPGIIVKLEEERDSQSRFGGYTQVQEHVFNSSPAFIDKFDAGVLVGAARSVALRVYSVVETALVLRLVRTVL